MSETPITDKPAENPASPLAVTGKTAATDFSLRRWVVVHGVSVVAILLVLGITLYFCVPGFYIQETDDAYVEAHVISVMPKLAAYAATLHMDDNARVHAGDLLLELDPRDFLIASNLARANLAVTESRLGEARSQVTVAQAGLREDQAGVELAASTALLATSDLQRLAGVSDSRAVARENLDAASAAADGAQAMLTAAKMKASASAARLDLAQHAVQTAEAAVGQARAELDRAKLDLSYANIYAPVSGTLAARNVEAGDYVQPGQLLFSLVPDDVYVVANYKETQLKRMRPGQKALVRADAFPNLTWSGQVDSIQRGTGSRFALLPPENATGNFVKVVQRVPVKIVLDHPDATVTRLSPGMSVEVRVYFSGEAR